MDLLNQLPVKSSRFDDLIQSMELNGISTVDLLVRSNSSLLKKLNRSITEIENFENHLTTIPDPIDIQHKFLDIRNNPIKTGLEELDTQLSGGISGLVEIYGQSGTGKSQLLYQIVANSLKLVFITTEKYLETKRLKEIIDANNKNLKNKVSLDDIDYIYCPDLEVQHHILFHQLPLKLSTGSIQTVVIDSIGHHLRHEGLSNINFFKDQIEKLEVDLETLRTPEFYNSTKKEFYLQYNKFFKVQLSYDSSMQKKYYIHNLYHHLNNLILEFGVTIVITNQVSEQLPMKELSPLDLNYQMGGIVGWDETTIRRSQSGLSFASVDSSSFDLSLYGTQGDTTILNLENQVNDVLQDQIVDHYQEINFMVNTYYKEHMSKFQIPSLGYNWIKNVPTRILLLKSYKPVIIKDLNKISSKSYPKSDDSLNTKTAENFNENNNCERTHKRQKLNKVSFNSLVEGWQINRYIKLTPDNPLIKFQITASGLIEEQIN